MHLPEVDIIASVVDWVIDYPESMRVFEEFSIDYFCAGKSLEQACREANTSVAVVGAKLRIIVDTAGERTRRHSRHEQRPMSYWIEVSPPGWIARESVAEVDPLQVAAEVYKHGQCVGEWLLPGHERCETFELQCLSAALFNRYRVETNKPNRLGSRSTMGLHQLAWTPQSEAIQCCLAGLQQLLLAPFAVFKAIRLPLSAEHYPSPDELQQAEIFLLEHRGLFGALIAQLGHAIEEYRCSLNPTGPAGLLAQTPSVINRKE
ncbi:DUF542 domain-containing protein [Anatilimnocola floriformis]|uniref:DUF542 domain-containing protein n=1 Tax=Anatilimnocola floriformis TaxID=2948575 RepID=UPI0020C1C7A7|nr:DUF542 domain-containing protein [Anatilimnocola floriformis]